MKKSIRRNVYETNSSSTHSICVTKNNILDSKTDFAHFAIREFGWEYNMREDLYFKASYLYTAILSNENDKDKLINSIKKILDKNKIKYEFEEPVYSEHGYLESGYIDHSDELYDFPNICLDEDKLMRFLFSSESFIVTGNDNDDFDVNINVNYDHDEYYKGN